MRIANYRDDVLWAIAYKLGVDPAKEFLTDEGESINSYVNAWVRRTYDNRDFPEWTETLEFTPDARHIVAYHSIPVGKSLPVFISRPLKVYLVDPLATPYPIDTPFRENEEGLHVGFDHGATVWIKFLPLAPRFTSVKWEAERNYGKGELTYSPEEGDCFASLVNNNKGNDPAIGYTQAIPTSIIQLAEPPNPGHAGQNQIVDAYTIPYTPQPAAPTSVTTDPPGPGTTYRIAIKDKPGGGGVVIADVTYLVQAGDGWPEIVAGVAAALTGAAGLAGFTITSDAAAPKVRLSHASDFRVSTWYQQGPGDAPQYFNKQVQVQVYIAEVPATPGQPQIVQVTIGASQVKAEAIYQLTFRDLAGAVHSVEYESIAGDGITQILVGLATAISTSTDTFFQNVAVTVDTTLGTMQISTVGGISIDATLTPETSTYWEKILFPYALVEPVVRGAYSDALREAGQTDKALAEEQGAVQEEGAQANKTVAPAYDNLTDQQRPAPRYRTRPVPIAPGR